MAKLLYSLTSTFTTNFHDDTEKNVDKRKSTTASPRQQHTQLRAEAPTTSLEKRTASSKHSSKLKMHDTERKPQFHYENFSKKLV